MAEVNRIPRVGYARPPIARLWVGRTKIGDTIRKTPTGQLETWIAAQIIEIVGDLTSAGNGKLVRARWGSHYG
jgi:hypothetical protein